MFGNDKVCHDSDDSYWLNYQRKLEVGFLESDNSVKKL